MAETAETDPMTEQLEAVRTAIDEIDEEIVALIWRRERLVRLAGGLKDDDAQVLARDRVDEVITHVRQAAEAQDQDSTVVERTYRAMIDAFIEYELRTRREDEAQARLDAFSRS
ncbi:chorismate mutase [Arthrobacter sp. Helios]|uniref:chorismate mutase n=1 Tax=Arthrobacter sp. Helios TaxID=2828862 RepID=UPI00205E9642|nr:chorismate mutase [Arthrobacter sp. Helios]UPO78467.1 chorismate mutase [Arthrobacter sp. Helios]